MRDEKIEININKNIFINLLAEFCLSQQKAKIIINDEPKFQETFLPSKAY
jgi:hypothetical protein